MFSLSNTTNVPQSVVTTTGSLTHINSATSNSGGVESGSSSGVHEYTFTSNVNVVDISAGETLINTVGGSRATRTGDIWKKNVAGNSWNSSVRSTETFSGSDNWGLSWEVTNRTGTVRQMGGITQKTGDSYSTMTHAIYQVNTYFYSRVYELGKSIVVYPMDDVNKHVSVGDRFGLSVANGVVSYFIMKGTTIFPMFTSPTEVTGEGIKWHGAMHRGVGSSGLSEFGKVWKHVNTFKSISTESIRGVSDAILSPADIIKLNNVGMTVEAGSTYSSIYFTRSATGAYDNGGTPYPLEMSHQYEAILNQDVKSITF